MSDPKPSLRDRLIAWWSDQPETRQELIALLQDAHSRNLIDSDSYTIVEAALQVSELTVRDVMIPRAQMDAINVDAPIAEVIAKAIDTRHSRFPVVGETRDDVIGILLAKDLLQAVNEPERFDLRGMLRPAVYIPESKPLTVLLREFRVSRNHMAIVIDEYGGVAGLATIEDVLEQIVGDIADEHDFDEEDDNIIAESAGVYRVKAGTDIADLNSRLGAEFDLEQADTVGGLVLQGFGRLPKRNEHITLGEWLFTVARADSRRIVSLRVQKAGTRPVSPET